MAEVAKNQRLWNSLVAQAESKYPSRRGKGITWAAAKWAKDQYVMKGGEYVGSLSEVPRQFRDLDKEARDKKEDKKKRVEAEKKKRGLL